MENKMITKMGNKVLKENSKKMSKLTTRYIALGKELAKIDPKKVTAHTDYVNIINEAKMNRAEWQELQDEITLLCGLEQWLKQEQDLKRPTNPKGW